MATTGACTCGNVKWSFEGEAIASALCHCNRCKRSNGSLCSMNLIVPAPAFRETSGKAKTYTSKGGSGADSTSHFCDNCGSPLYITSDAAPGIIIIKSGTIDDVTLLQGKYKPGLEIYCDSKLDFVPKITEMNLSEGMAR